MGRRPPTVFLVTAKVTATGRRELIMDGLTHSDAKSLEKALDEGEPSVVLEDGSTLTLQPCERLSACIAPDRAAARG